MDQFVGMIIPFPYTNFVPKGWFSCEGQSLPISSYQVLYALIGTTYGGNGATTFNLPDLRGRGIVGTGKSAAGTNYNPGQTHDQYQVTISTNQMTAHTHVLTINANPGAQNLNTPTGNYLGGGDTGNQMYTDQTPSDSTLNAGTVTMPNVGSGVPVTIQAPYLAMYYGIAYEGLYPTRQ